MGGPGLRPAIARSAPFGSTGCNAAASSRLWPQAQTRSSFFGPAAAAQLLHPARAKRMALQLAWLKIAKEPRQDAQKS